MHGRGVFFFFLWEGCWGGRCPLTLFFLFPEAFQSVRAETRHQQAAPQGGSCPRGAWGFGGWGNLWDQLLLQAAGGVDVTPGCVPRPPSSPIPHPGAGFRLARPAHPGAGEDLQHLQSHGHVAERGGAQRGGAAQQGGLRPVPKMGRDTTGGGPEHTKGCRELVARGSACQHPVGAWLYGMERGCWGVAPPLC